MNMKSQAGGPTGFEELKIYDNSHHNFYKDACNARGLLNDDGEWLQCLQDAATYQIPKKFRLLFATMIRQTTINKAQGQSINNLGVFLPQPVFYQKQVFPTK